LKLRWAAWLGAQCGKLWHAVCLCCSSALTEFALPGGEAAVITVYRNSMRHTASVQGLQQGTE
jgi:hypothetical protein